MATTDVIGTVVDASGDTVSDAKVSATESGSTTVYASTTTSSNGSWVLELASGVKYTPTATKSGESDLTVKVDSGVNQDSLSLGIGFTAVEASY